MGYEIIKHGKFALTEKQKARLDTTVVLKFTCPACECEFKIQSDDVSVVPRMTSDEFVVEYIRQCPECTGLCYQEIKFNF